MLNFPSSYIRRTSPVHACDPRVKVLLLLAYSITLFCVETWRGLLLCGLFLLAVWSVSRLPFARVAGMLAPLYAILACTLAFNAFALDVSSAPSAYGLGGVSAGVFAGFDPVPLVGSFGFVPSGFGRGLYYVLRIVFLGLASLILAFSTTAYDLMEAMRSFLSPLRRFRVPVDDLATVFSLALRFVPVLGEELSRIHGAQWSRGASFDEGGIKGRLSAWSCALIPLFVGLFRRADRLATAMESRCYGGSPRRTHLSVRLFGLKEAFVLAVGIALCAVLACLC